MTEEERERHERAVNRVVRGGAVVAELSAREYCERLGVEPTTRGEPLVPAKEPE